MAFLFKSKKHQEKALSGGRDAREGSLNGSQGSMQSPDARARVAREEKTHRSTPTGSLNSIDNDAVNASPDNGFSPSGPIRRAQTGDVVPQSGDIQPQVSLLQSASKTASLSNSPFYSSCGIIVFPPSLLINTPLHIDSQRPCARPPNKSQLLALPLVTTKDQLHISTSRPISAVWRCC